MSTVDQSSPPEPTATDLLVQIAETRGMIQAHAIRQEAVNGSAPTLTERPYWQDQACPPWCHMTVGHQDQDRPEDRVHMAPFHDIQLTLEAADDIRIPSPGGEVGREVSPSFITAGLTQGWRDREATISLIHCGQHDILFTVAEAAELIEALTDCVRQATGQQ